MSIEKTMMMAELSEASYADFSVALQSDGSYLRSRVKNAITNIGGAGNGFSNTQASDFVSRWRVVDHLPNTITGFSATVFESIANPGSFVLATRGTELLLSQFYQDVLLADIADIGADGIALNQAIDLFNYYQRLTTPTGSQAVQYEVYEGILPPPPGLQEYILINEGSGPLGAPVFRYVRV